MTYDNTPHLIVTGNPVDGLQFYGPFDDAQEALAFANTDPHLPDEWWIAPLHSPDDTIC